MHSAARMGAEDFARWQVERGDLARLDTPDNDSGKVGLVTNTVTEGVQTMLYVAIVVVETEEHVYLRKELKRL